MVNLGTAMAYLDLDNSRFNSALSSSLSQLNIFADKTATVGDKIGAVGGTMTRAGTALSLGLTVPLAGLATTAVKTASEFETTMSKVEAISGATADEMELLAEKAKDMGATTAFSAKEAAEGLTYMAMAGWKTQDMLDGLDGIMNLAAADGLDLATTSDIVTDALTAFGLTASDSAHFADVLAVAASSSNTNVEMLGESFKYAASTAGALNYSVEDIGLALGLMANSGIKSSQAGTALRSTMARLVKPTDDMVEKMKELGLATTQTQVIMDDDAIASAQEQITKKTTSLEKAESRLADKTLKLEEAQSAYNETVAEYGVDSDKAAKAALKVESAQNSMQQAVDAAATAQDNLAQSMNKLAAAQQGTVEEGEAQLLLMEDAEGNARSFREVMLILRESFSDLSETEKANAAATLFGQEAMAGMLAIINASPEDFDKLTEAIDNADGTAEKMADTMLDNLEGSITILKSGIEGLAISFGEILIPALDNIVKYITKVVEKLNALDEETKKTIVQIGLVAAAIGPVLLVSGSLLKVIGNVSNSVKSLTAVFQGASTMIGGVSASVLGVLAALAALAAAIVYLWNTNEEFRQGVISAWEEIKEEILKATSTLQPVFEKFKEVFENLWIAIQPLIIILGETLVSVLNLVAPLIQVMVQVLTPVLDVLADILLLLTDIIALLFTRWDDTNAISGIGNKIKEDFGGLLETLKEYVTEFLAWVEEKEIELFNKVMDFLGIDYSFDKLVEDVGPALNKLLEQFQILGDKIKEIKDAVSAAFKPQAVIEFTKLMEKVKPEIDKIKAALKELAQDVSPMMLALKDAFEPFMESIGLAVSAIADALGLMIALLSGDKEQIAEAAKQYAESVNAWKDKIMEVFIILARGFAESLMNIWDTLKSWVANLVESLKQMFVDALISIKDSFVEFFTVKIPEAFQSFMEYLTHTPERIGEAIAAMIYKFDEFNTALKEKMDSASASIGEAIKSWPDKIKTAIEQMMQEVETWKEEFPQKAHDAAKDFADEILTGLNTAKTSVETWWENLEEFFKGLPEKFKQAGTDMMVSLFDAIKTVGDNITGWMKEWIGSIREGISKITTAMADVSQSDDSSGSYSSGLDYVPYDGYSATLHEGERVLTKQENEMSQSPTSFVQNIFAQTPVNRYTLMQDTEKMLREAGVI